MSDLLEKIKGGREYRHMVQPLASVEAEDTESYNVRGYATTFNEPYTLYDNDEYCVEEQIDAHAFDECDLSDIIMQYDHTGRVYARTSNKTLELTIDGHGLLINAYLGGTENGRNLYGEIKGGYTNKMSFGFRVGADEIEEREVNGKTIYRRTVQKVTKLFDVSAVSLPANDGTEISARSLCDGEIAKLEAERLVKAERAKAINDLKTHIDTILKKETKK